MQKAAWLMLASLLGVIPSNAHFVDSSFHNLVCRQCNSWCSVDQVVHIEPRIGKAGPRGPRGEKGDPGLPGVVNMSAIEELIEIKIIEAFSIRQITTEATTRLSLRQSTIEATTQQIKTYSSCRGINLDSAKSRNETGGVFDIDIPGVATKEVYCNTQTDGGGWMVFQRRLDGSVDFFRKWNEYVAGFGTARREYWLGLEAIHQLTKDSGAQLRIDMIAQDGTYNYAKYDNFKIGPASDNYRLTVSGYSGNATDCLSYYHNNRQFSTKDNDNDGGNRNCAASFSGAWWYNDCYYSNLNGHYKRQDWNGLVWRDRNNGDSKFHLKFVEMKIRQKN